jgi:hypothetical protein
MRVLLTFAALMLVLSACSTPSPSGGAGGKATAPGKTELTSFTSGTMKCEAWKEDGKYQALCVSTKPEMFLRAAERSTAAGGVGAFCDQGEVKDQPGFYFVRCSADESLADFIK